MIEDLVAFRDEIREQIENIKPRVTLGDDDSIYLTEFQEGEKDALRYALIEKFK